MNELVIYTDGACVRNPGPGGWAAIVVRDGRYEEYGGFEPQTTNNRMEIQGVLEGLLRARPGEQVRVVSDSRYLTDGASKWIHGWKRRGWRKADGEPVLNPDLWQLLDERVQGLKIRWEHVDGHSGHPENERCDKIAQGFARGKMPGLRSGDGSWIAEEAAPPEKPKKSAKPKKAEKTAEPDEKYPAPLYLSLVDGDVHEHATWGECETRIKGVKGARCKKVLSRNEHVAALVAWKDLV